VLSEVYDELFRSLTAKLVDNATPSVSRLCLDGVGSQNIRLRYNTILRIVDSIPRFMSDQFLNSNYRYLHGDRHGILNVVYSGPAGRRL